MGFKFKAILIADDGSKVGTIPEVDMGRHDSPPGEITWDGRTFYVCSGPDEIGRGLIYREVAGRLYAYGASPGEVEVDA